MNDIFNKILYGGGIIFDLFKWVIMAVVILVVINKFWLTIFFVDGLSMFPTLKDKEVVLLQKNSYTYNDPQRSDIVAVKYPGDPDHKKYVKRVVGLPGEKLTIKNGKVYINDKLLEVESKYLQPDVYSEPNGEWTMGTNEYFLMGDNRPGSNDSRYFGPVEKRFISGKAKAIIFPRERDLSKLY